MPTKLTYKNQVIGTTSCACGCGGTVTLKQWHMFPSVLKVRGSRFFLLGHIRRGQKYSASHCRAIRRGLQGKTNNKSGKEHYAWNGGISLTTDGYKSKWVAPRQRMREHRYVMERYLGRKLLRNEEVHHINHNPLDNRLENLRVMTRSEHARLHNAERWREPGTGRFAPQNKATPMTRVVGVSTKEVGHAVSR